MKKMLSVILLAGVFAGPVFAEESSVSAAVAMAQSKSGVSIDKLSLAVYEAVKAQPGKAVEIFQSVMSQRTSWSVTETYAVLRSVLLASPSLESSFVQSAASYQAGSYSSSVASSAVASTSSTVSSTVSSVSASVAFSSSATGSASSA